MIYVTGDTHGDFQRFQEEYFPEQNGMTKNDFVIICGDFGGVWDESKREERRLDWLEQLPFTVLFVSGNHENFDRLARYPVEEWHGGKVQRIRPHVIHLMRGQMFLLEGRRVFTMGGARSHDIEGGILSPYAEDFLEQCVMLRSMGARFRVNHRSWWKEELPSQAEYQEALETLDKNGWQADYVITHCAPSSIEELIGQGQYEHDHLTDFLEEVSARLEFRYWFFGHYHDNRVISDRFVLLYEQIAAVPGGALPAEGES